MSSKKRKRNPKVSLEQKEIYCNILEQHPALFQHKHTETGEELWQELTAILNETGCGAYHTIDEWKTVFDNWRYAVTHKLRKTKASVSSPALGAKSDLEKLEDRAAVCWGNTVIEKVADDTDDSIYDPISSIKGSTLEDIDSEDEFVKEPPRQVSQPKKRQIPTEPDEGINGRLDRIVVAIESLTAAQMATNVTLQKIAEALRAVSK